MFTTIICSNTVNLSTNLHGYCQAHLLLHTLALRKCGLPKPGVPSLSLCTPSVFRQMRIYPTIYMTKRLSKIL